jgi:hypothetical protein
MQAQARLTLAPDSAWTDVVSALAAPGPGRDAFAIQRTQVSVSGTASASMVPVYQGYRWVNYTPELARLSLVVRMPDGQLLAKEVQLRWLARGDDGDWKLVLPEAAQARTPQPVSSIDGYTAFSPEATDGN